MLDGAGYRVEVPKNWNGMLVMYAHGYGGTGPTVNVSDPPIREHLIRNGYALGRVQLLQELLRRARWH